MSITQVKSNLAKLLATENLTVEHSNVSTASFNVETRVLQLPVWENISNDVKKNNDIINYFYFSKIGQLFDEYELYYRPVINLSNYLSGNFNVIKNYEDVVNAKDEWVIKNLEN